MLSFWSWLRVRKTAKAFPKQKRKNRSLGHKPTDLGFLWQKIITLSC